MARWKLLEAHYLSVEGVEWEYKEVNRANGREIRKKFPVPLHLDPKIESDWNVRDGLSGDGYIAVAFGSGAQPRDHIMTKLQITPGMEPLDDEARKLQAEYIKNVPKVDGDENATYSERLLDKFIQDLADVQTKAQTSPPAQAEGIGDVLKAMTEMIAQNQQILTALTRPARRVP